MWFLYEEDKGWLSMPKVWKSNLCKC